MNKIIKFLREKVVMPTIVPMVVVTVLCGAIGLGYFEKRAYRAEIAALKVEFTEHMTANTNNHHANMNVLNQKIENLKALNKALVAQLDTRAEQVADVTSYILKTTKTVGSDIAGQVAENVVNMGIKYNVPTPVIVSVMEVESHFNLQAVGGVGERGLMQVRFKVWNKKLDIKSKYDLHNIRIGVEKGVQVLDISLKDCKYNLSKAIRQYNSGSTSRGSSIYVANVMKSMGKYEAHTALRQIIKDKQKREAVTVDTVNKGTAKVSPKDKDTEYPERD